MNDPATPPPVNKWSAHLDVGQPLSLIAREMIETRLDRVTEMLAGVGQHSSGSNEWVHQLRVATRRAQVAIEWFAIVLGRQRRDKVRRQLRRIRHAADAARNLDVLIAGLASSQSLDPSFIQSCLEQLHQQRAQAQQPLHELLDRLLPNRWPRQARRLLDTCRWRRSRGDREPTFAEDAGHQWNLQRRAYVERLSEPLDTTANLHQLRIATKRLRYAAELASPALGESFPAGLYERLTQLQDDLGAVNDHVTALRLLHDLLHIDIDQPAEPWQAWIEHHRRQLRSRQSRFHRRWPTSRLNELIDPPTETHPRPPR